MLSVGVVSVSLNNLSAAAADEPGKFVGTWKGAIAGYDEIWTVRNKDGSWSINGKFQVRGMDAGSFIGADIKESMGTLTFTRRFVKNPKNPALPDEVAIIVKTEGENLSYTWSTKGKKGASALERTVEGAEKTTEKTAADALGRFKGVWAANVATGFRVVMQISQKEEKVEVAANYFNKKGLLAGAFVGADVTLKDGVLTFSQQFLKKPVSTWSNGKLHTLEIVSDNVLKFSWKGGSSESFTRISK
ncbi:MAG: hypothetical protein U0793_18400 [Gemmataceae bacterium]